LYVAVKLDASSASVTLDVMQEMFKTLEMDFARVLHELGELSNGKGESYECIHQVNQRSNPSSILKPEFFLKFQDFDVTRAAILFCENRANW
jgi:hypothetical protein